MKTETKAELKDRIAHLEWCEKHSTNIIEFWQGETETFKRMFFKKQAEAKRATIAAYACLAVIFVLVGVGVIWN
jgi:negative regulator of sigma E activity